MKQLLACLFLLFSSQAAFAQTPFQNWLKDHSHPVEIRVNANQLTPIRDQLASARIIGLGEATHATSEFFTFKDHLFRYLVEELDHRVFVLEAGFSECEVTNAYIQHGIGTPESAIGATGFWIWNTVEMVELIQWMRQFNQDRPEEDQIRFYGMDMQGTRFPATYLRNFALDNDTDITLRFSPMLKELAQRTFVQLEPEMAATYLRELDSLQAHMQRNRPKYEAKLGRKAAGLALQHARILWQSVSTWNGTNNGSWRDQCMADNVRWVLEQEGENSKAVVWAHNAHLMRRKNKIGWSLLGTHLAHQYGDLYFALGFDFAKGNFRAYDHANGLLRTHTVELPKGKNRYWNSLIDLPGNASWVDLRSVKGQSQVEKYLNRHSSLRSIGGKYLPSHFVSIRHYPIQNAFDALVFMDETTASKSLDGNSQFKLAALSQSIPWPRKWRKRNVRIEALMRVRPREQQARGMLNVRINDRYGHDLVRTSQQAFSPRWSPVRLEFEAPNKGKQLVLTLVLHRLGMVDVDDVKVWVQKKEEWIPVKVPNGGFEDEELREWSSTTGEGLDFERLEEQGNRFIRLQNK